MDKRQKITLARIVAATLLLAAACCVPKSAATPRLLLFGAAYLAVGADVLVKAVLRLFRGSLFDENFLMSLATVGAFAIGEYPEAVAVMLFYQIGELFQEIAVTRSRASISALMDIRPDYARLENSGGETRQVAPETVPTGSVIVVRAGEKIPLDGTVIAGSSSLDTAALTGESLPREVTEGDAVLNGSLNLTGCCAFVRRAPTANRPSPASSSWSSTPRRARPAPNSSSRVLPATIPPSSLRRPCCWPLSYRS